MNLGDPRERRLDAGEYVLGTLSPEDRREFERALPGDAALRADVRFWETHFATLGLRLAPVAPRSRVWLDIAHRLGTAAPAPAPRQVFLKTWAALATAASLVLAFGLYREMTAPPPAPVVVTERVEVPVPATSYVALLQVPASTMHWSVAVTPAKNQLVVVAGGEAPAAAAKLDAELWVITDAGPVSMGVIPKTGELRRELPAGLRFAGGTLAVSLEPPGGSPTGQPTGPVVVAGPALKAL